MNKKVKIFISITAVCVLVLCTWLYIDFKMYCKTYFPSDTFINQIDCSGMNLDAAKKTLTKTWNEKEFVITENNKRIAVLKNMDFDYAIDDQLQAIIDNDYKFPLITSLLKKNDNLTIIMTPAEPTKEFAKQVKALPVYDQEEPIGTKDAYVDMSTHEFSIVPEVYGNNIDQDVLMTAIMDKIAAGSWELNYIEKEFYAQPRLKKDSEEVLAQQTYCKTYLAHEITYNFGGQKETISPKEMNEMISVDDSGKITVNEKKVKAFVSDLAEKYNTVDTERSFKSTSRGNVTIYGGTYGYEINEPEERKQLIKDLKELKSVSREPVYAQEGWGWDNNGFGSTYVEVDLALQKLWYYQNGKMMMTCPIVSGCVTTNHQTVTGAFQIAYMATDVTLKGGSKKKKTYYESHVDYWMPFYGDYGLHDADWRSSFGGSIYYSGGSHGCVNMPPASGAQLYNLVSTGTPVIVFY